jgi:putative NADH-flavin reductase
VNILMRVVVFGATGGTGLQLVKQALEAGYQVTALVRPRTKFQMQHEQLRILQGDVLDPACVDAAVTGQDAVLSALGTNQRGPVTICADSMKSILTAMTTQGVHRLVAISAYGAADSHHRLSSICWRWRWHKPPLRWLGHLEFLIFFACLRTHNFKLITNDNEL